MGTAKQQIGGDAVRGEGEERIVEGVEGAGEEDHGDGVRGG